MDIVPLTKDLYPIWDEFCPTSDDAWFWHTSAWLEYTLNLKPESGSESRSFMLTDDSKVVAICPLVLQKEEPAKNIAREFSYGGGPCFAPAFSKSLGEKKRKKAAEVLFGEIDRLAEQEEVKRITIRLSPLANSFWESRVPNNYLLKFGFIDISLHTQVIDLSEAPNRIWGNVRHGHKYDINRAKRTLEMTILHKGNVTADDFRAYREMHHKAAGRVTRSLTTFEMMYDWILTGNAVLALGKFEGNLAGAAYVMIDKGSAYYASAANDPDLPSTVPIGHGLQWKLIEWLRENGCRRYELGSQQYGNLPHNFPSEKEIHISGFKRGFGGSTLPQFTGEKYYSREYFIKVCSERMSRFAGTIQGDRHAVKIGAE
ncbi:MAG TPA: GNAT family N-acetyltransferase [Blastocatellia bacterium]|nr:GNAT family N-acetyltransferase [Blastocatellia bacterium]